jgi:hypothetical protein
MLDAVGCVIALCIPVQARDRLYIGFCIWLEGFMAAWLHGCMAAWLICEVKVGENLMV